MEVEGLGFRFFMDHGGACRGKRDIRPCLAAPALRWLISFDLIHVPRLNPKPFTLAIN